MIIRNAVDSDLISIVDIYNQSIPGRTSTADLLPFSVEQKIDWFHSHNEKRPIKVAEKDGKIIGWLSMRNFYGRPAYSGTVEISIYVSYQEHNKGVGNAMLNHIIQIAPELEIHSLVGFIFAHNLPSISLFKKYGFEEWGLLPEIAILVDEKASLMILGKKIN